jgi:hypothetical protein
MDIMKWGTGHVTPNLCFCIRWDLRVTWCILVRLGHKTLRYYFTYLGWDWHGYDKMCTGTRYPEHVFLHPVGYAGHVVHYGASGA